MRFLKEALDEAFGKAGMVTFASRFVQCPEGMQVKRWQGKNPAALENGGILPSWRPFIRSFFC